MPYKDLQKEREYRRNYRKKNIVRIKKYYAKYRSEHPKIKKRILNERWKMQLMKRDEKGRLIKSVDRNEKRYCSICNKLIEFDYKKGYFAGICNVCDHTRKKEKLTKIIHDYYGNKCLCCGETNPIFLTLDHIKNNGFRQKRHGRKLGGLALYTWLIINGFPEGYQLLCYNCNCGKFRNKGICPHEEKEIKIHPETEKPSCRWCTEWRELKLTWHNTVFWRHLNYLISASDKTIDKCPICGVIKL